MRGAEVSLPKETKSSTQQAKETKRLLERAKHRVHTQWSWRKIIAGTDTTKYNYKL